MEIFKPNGKNSKLYQKIDYKNLLIIFVVSFLVFTLFFYYIGKQQSLDSSIYTSLLISGLIVLGSIIGDILENRYRVFIYIEDNTKDELGFIEIHREKIGGDFLREIEFEEILSKYNIEEIYKDNNKFEGIDKGIIKEVLSVKKKYNETVIKVKTSIKQWKSASIFSISKLYVVDKECVKKIVIPNDYDNYEKLIKKIKKIYKI